MSDARHFETAARTRAAASVCDPAARLLAARDARNRELGIGESSALDIFSEAILGFVCLRFKNSRVHFAVADALMSQWRAATAADITRRITAAAGESLGEGAPDAPPPPPRAGDRARGARRRRLPRAGDGATCIGDVERALSDMEPLGIVSSAIETDERATASASTATGARFLRCVSRRFWSIEPRRALCGAAGSMMLALDAEKAPDRLPRTIADVARLLWILGVSDMVPSGFEPPYPVLQRPLRRRQHKKVCTIGDDDAHGDAPASRRFRIRGV